MSWFSNPHTRPYIDLGWTIALYLDQVLGCINHFGLVQIDNECTIVQMKRVLDCSCWCQLQIVLKLGQIKNECCQVQLMCYQVLVLFFVKIAQMLVNVSSQRQLLVHNLMCYQVFSQVQLMQYQVQGLSMILYQIILVQKVKKVLIVV